MELEQRVKALEYEMKIVKNEIQRTLLDIQEQVLVHYYPTLRLEESGTPKGVIETVEVIRAKQGPPEVAAPAPAPAAPAPAAPAPAPTVKKITLEEARAVASSGAPAAEPAGAVNIVHLVDWATNSSVKIGGERIAKLVEVYGTKALITPDIKAILLQVTTLYKLNPATVSTNDVIAEAIKFDMVLGRPANPEEAIALIEEAGLG
jgi:hypothetical protein